MLLWREHGVSVVLEPSPVGFPGCGIYPGNEVVFERWKRAGHKIERQRTHFVLETRDQTQISLAPWLSDPWQQGWICLIPNCRFGSIQGFWETAHLPRRHYESDQKSGWWRQEGEEAIQGPSFLGFTEKKGRLNIFCQKYRNSCLYLRRPSFNKSCNLIFQKYCWGNGTKLSG